METAAAQRGESKKRSQSVPKVRAGIPSALENEPRSSAGMPLFLQRTPSSSANHLLDLKDENRSANRIEDAALTIGQPNNVHEQEAVKQSASMDDRAMRAISDGSPDASPERFAGALGQMSGASQVGMMRQLQRSYGNSYVGRVIQAKLTVNQPGDRYEQEADRVAEQVMQMSEPVVQRQMDLEEDEEERMVQRKAIVNQVAPLDHNQASFEVPPSVNEVLRSPGQSLDQATRALMETRFGHDFSQVRVHSGAAAERSAREVNAHAYTVSHNIVFGAGRFTPGTNEGQRLLAHELTHVLQQIGSNGIRVGKSNEKFGLSPIPLSPQPQVPSQIQRQPKDSGAICTGITIRLPNSITFEGTEGQIKASVKTEQVLQPGTYKVSYDAAKGELFIDTPGGTLLSVSGTSRGTAQQRAAEEALFNAYLRSLSTPVTLTVIGAGSGGGSGGTGAGGTLQSPPTEVREEELKKPGGEEESGRKGGVPEGTGVKKPETSEPKPSGNVGGEQKGGEKTSPEYADKLKALLDGIETKPLDPEIERQLKSILDKLSLDDIALFKQFAVKNLGGDMEGFLRSLRLFESTKEIYEKQPLPSKPAEVSSEAEKVLADAMKKFDPAKMTREEKEALARATVSAMSNAQMKNMTAAQIAESIVRVDKAAMSSGQDMSEGMKDAIKGTGWERAAGIARGVKGASGFWAMLCFAAIIFSAFIPGVNVLVLATHAMVAGMVAYAAATLQSEAEIKAAGGAQSAEDFQQKIVRGTEARMQAITNAVAMALPIAGKLIGKIPLPLGLKNVSTALKIAKVQLKSKATGAFTKAKATALEALTNAKTDLQPYSIQFRQTIATIVQRLRKTKGADLVAEIKSTPELQGLFGPEDFKALEGLSVPELELAKKSILESLDNAPETATATVGHINGEISAVEAKVAAATTAKELDEALSQAAKLEDPNKIVTEAGTEARVKVAQDRVNRLSELSVPEVKKAVNDLLNDVNNKVPKSHPKRPEVLKGVQELKQQIADLEKRQGKTDISQELEDIDQRVSELDDLIADAVAEANARRKAPAQKTAPKKQPGPKPAGQQPKQLREGNEYDAAHQFDYEYRETYVQTKDGRYKLDGYDPGKEIVSRKRVELSKQSSSVLKGYIKEFETKYSRGTLIADVPSSGIQTKGGPVKARLNGTLQGEYILEVAIQETPVPVEILLEAKNAGVTIRDVAGKVYALKP